MLMEETTIRPPLLYSTRSMGRQNTHKQLRPNRNLIFEALCLSFSFLQIYVSDHTVPMIYDFLIVFTSSVSQK